MPKERFHLLLAEQVLENLRSSATLAPFRDEFRFVYLVGALHPDSLFYDFPTFSFSRLGSLIHTHEGEAILPIASALMSEAGRTRDRVFAWWILGSASHFLADGFWHPAIREMSHPCAFYCRRFNFSEKQCHHWLESQLESYWLQRWGPQDGYVKFLADLCSTSRSHMELVNYLGRFLAISGTSGKTCNPERLRQCLYWQARSLAFFLNPYLKRYQRLLLRISALRLLGTLIVPEECSLPKLQSREADGGEFSIELLSEDLLRRSITFVVTRLQELAELF